MRILTREVDRVSIVDLIWVPPHHTILTKHLWRYHGKRPILISAETQGVHRSTLYLSSTSKKPLDM
jgi:hypothetical protein